MIGEPAPSEAATTFPGTSSTGSAAKRRDSFPRRRRMPAADRPPGNRSAIVCQQGCLERGPVQQASLHDFPAGLTPAGS